MKTTVFAELGFWALVLFSFVVPVIIYGVLLVKRAVSPKTSLLLGICLVVIAGLDVFLLQSMANAAKSTPSLSDDVVFLSELSVALYLLPATFGGIGINLVSHVLLRHIEKAERVFEREHPGR
ncbi:MAG TPA: hypothetical protein VEC35_17045 [Noviherbaspirillum sp.]|nr:hypothetical protein [Noviherbaspirillum sp.]